MDKGVVLDLKRETNKQGPHCVTQADFKHSVFWVLGLQVCHHAQRFTHIKQTLYHGVKFMSFHSLFFIFLDARLWHFLNTKGMINPCSITQCLLNRDQWANPGE